MTTPAFAILADAKKQSARDRWSDHFRLQLRAERFRIISQAEYEGLTFHDGTEQNKIVVAEYKFHPERKWRFDFAIPALKLGIEIEGGIWRGRGWGSKTANNPGGAHSHPTNILRDIEKQNAATMLGWRLLRLSENEIRSGESIRMTVDLASRGSPPG